MVDESPVHKLKLLLVSIISRLGIMKKRDNDSIMLHLRSTSKHLGFMSTGEKNTMPALERLKVMGEETKPRGC